MKYNAQEWLKKSLKMQFDFFADASRHYADFLEALRPMSLFPALQDEAVRNLEATADFLNFLGKDYPKPAFGIDTVTIAGNSVDVTLQNVDKKPYGTLKHFQRATKRNDPKVLIVPPTSGHYATTMRETIEDLLPGHDVYVVDWENARDVDVTQGDFGLEDYITYLQDFLAQLGPDTHIIGFSQSTVPVLATTALMSARDDENQPLSMTLMGGPIDVRAEKNAVSDYADKYTLDWFQKNVIMTVPEGFEGAGQKVYPGFLQLAGFVGLHAGEHAEKHQELWHSLLSGDVDKAEEIKEFYNEYLAVSDLSARFYLDTIQHVYKDFSLPRGTLEWQGACIETSKITKTGLLTVAGDKDDIVAPKQTTAAHDLCDNLPQERQRSMIVAGAGHYDLCSGVSWKNNICPAITDFIRDMAQKSGLSYDAPPPEMVSSSNKNRKKNHAPK